MQETDATDSPSTPKKMSVPVVVAFTALLLLGVVANHAGANLQKSRAALPEIEGIAAAGPRTMAADFAAAPANFKRLRIRQMRCDQCGVIQSSQPADELGSLPAFYVTIVRLEDGSTRIFNDRLAGRWHPGERITFIDGGNPARR
jgi:hypothetical protein